MTNEMVQASLIYFHQHNIFLYFHSILPNLVFLNQQVHIYVHNFTLLTHQGFAL